MSRALWLGELSYERARELQEGLVAERQRDAIGDSWILVSHPPTVTLGKRSSTADFPFGRARLEEAGVRLIEVARGGGPTYHGPGQLVLYPVVRLADRGVKQFVSEGLSLLCSLASHFGVRATGLLEPAGVWVDGGRAKLGAVGLKIERGVTNHGFSLNVNPALEVYDLFHPCSQRGAQVTSLERELGARCPKLRAVAEHAITLLERIPRSEAGKAELRVISTYPGG